MKHIYVRPLRSYDPEDVARCEKALTEANAYIPKGAFAWPGTRVLVAEKDGVPVLYQPIYTSYILGSLGPCSKSDTDLASAQHQIVAAMVYESQKTGFGELLFMGGHVDTEAFAKRHEFEDFPHPLFRMRLNNAE